MPTITIGNSTTRTRPVSTTAESGRGGGRDRGRGRGRGRGHGGRREENSRFPGPPNYLAPNPGTQTQPHNETAVMRQPKPRLTHCQ